MTSRRRLSRMVKHENPRGLSRADYLAALDAQERALRAVEVADREPPHPAAVRAARVRMYDAPAPTRAQIVAQMERMAVEAAQQ